MNDPWHQETADALLAFIENACSAERSAIALVVTSSRALEDEVVAELERRLDPSRIVRWLDLRLFGEPELGLAGILRSDPEPGRVAFIRGLAPETPARSDDLSRGDEKPAESSQLLRYANLNRELFARASEAYLLLTSEAGARSIAEHAADLNRFTSSFRFISLLDVFESAEPPSWPDPKPDVLAEDPPGRLSELLKPLGELGGGQRAPIVGDEIGIQELCSAYWLLIEALRPTLVREIVQHVEASIDRVRGAADRGSSYHLLMSDRLRAGDVRGGLAFGRDASQALATAGLLEEQASVLSLMASALVDSGSLGEAATVAGEAATLFEKIGMEERSSDQRDMQDRILLVIGRPTQATEAHRHPREATVRTDRSSWAFRQSWRVMLDLQLSLDATTGARRLGGAARVLSRLGFLGVRASCIASFGTICLLAGRIGLARRLLDEVYELFASCDEAALMIAVACDRLAVLVALGHADRAVEAAQSLLAVAQRLGRSFVVAEIRAQLGLAHEAQGDRGSAIRELQQARDEYEGMGAVLPRIPIVTGLARLSRLEGDRRAARRLAGESAQEARRLGALPHLAAALTECAFQDLERGDVDAARANAQEALDIIRRTGACLLEPAALAAKACAHHAGGRQDLARSMHARWVRLVEGMRARGLRGVIERSLVPGMGYPPVDPSE